MLLVAVLILFLITEFPQGILGLLSGILEKCFFAQCYNLMGEMMDLLALINAAIGFVLYGLMSKQFRTSFKSVFFKTPLSRIEMTRITNLNNTTCVWRRINPFIQSYACRKERRLNQYQCYHNAIRILIRGGEYPSDACTPTDNLEHKNKSNKWSDEFNTMIIRIGLLVCQC